MPVDPKNSACRTHAGDNEKPAITDNLELLKGQLAENSLAHILVQARQAAPQDASALKKVMDKRIEQLREHHADAADQDN